MKESKDKKEMWTRERRERNVSRNCCYILALRGAEFDADTTVEAEASTTFSVEVTCRAR